MNPSSAGWIQKFLKAYPKEDLMGSFPSLRDCYIGLKEVGFLYGVSINTLFKKPVSTLKLTKEEFTKINLFHALLYVYYTEFPMGTPKAAVETLVDFYTQLEKGKPGFFQKFTFTKKATDNLERIIGARLQESNALIKNEAASLFTYALLFADVLTLRYYLTHQNGLKNYLEALEETLIQFSIWALNSKIKKNKYDLLVIEMVTESSQYLTQADSFDHSIVDQLKEMTYLEKYYVLDICCLAVWDDKEIDKNEMAFLEDISHHLELPYDLLPSSMATLQQFSSENAQKIKLFEYQHPVKQFYRQSTQTVKLLILRNKNRLMRELAESGELLKLLSQSTVRELTPEEKGKVREQLLDICKTIPSLTIFMLPGGTLLLPLMVKLIPKLLPSAFHENRIDD